MEERQSRSVIAEGLKPRGSGERRLAPYANDWRRSRGRLICEPASPTRSIFQRDRDRIIHSDAFRRLMHKTQVFVLHDGDHFRTRLTHSIEVGQIARALARGLSLDEDLAEALALVHDFGHTPFGHAGERALNDRLESVGGFDHNAQSLRVVTELERRYAGFDGLNLSWETLEGLVKHNGPLLDPPPPIAEFSELFDLELATWSSAEAQCAAIADDIAYDNHDTEDGLRAGMFTIDELREVSFSRTVIEEVETRHPDLPPDRMIHEIVRRQITRMVEDVLSRSIELLKDVPSAVAVRHRPCPSVAFSPSMSVAERELKTFLFKRLYRHPAVLAPAEAGEAITRELFDAYADGDAALPDAPEWSLDGLDEAARLRRIGDFIAGMTDRFAVREHQRWFDRTPALG